LEIIGDLMEINHYIMINNYKNLIKIFILLIYI
jgi:hypothetical protein